MKLLFLLIKDFINKIIRHLYWFYRLMQIKGIQQTKIKFPIIVEGKGNTEISSKCSLFPHSIIRVQKGSFLKIGNNVTIQSYVHLNISLQSKLFINDNVTISENTTIAVRKKSSIGTTTFIGTHVKIFSREALSASIKIGNYCGIGDGTIIDVSDETTIENYVAIGPNCTIYTHDHDYSNLNLPAWKGGIKTAPVYIKKNSWIGSNVTILPGIIIGVGCVVAAGSIVTKSIPDYEIWGGSPAKFIKKRN